MHLATFARVYASDLDGALALFEGEPRLRFSHASGLELALIGDVLILAGPAEILDRFRTTQVTVLVDDLDAVIAEAGDLRGRILRGPATQPTGRNVTIAHEGGAVIEYVEWSATTRAQVGL